MIVLKSTGQPIIIRYERNSTNVKMIVVYKNKRYNGILDVQITNYVNQQIQSPIGMPEFPTSVSAQTIMFTNNLHATTTLDITW